MKQYVHYFHTEESSQSTDMIEGLKHKRNKNCNLSFEQAHPITNIKGFNSLTADSSSTMNSSAQSAQYLVGAVSS